MKAVYTISKYFLITTMVFGLVVGCSKKDAELLAPGDNADSSNSTGPTFQASLISSVTGRPLAGVRVRVLVVNGNKYVEPESYLGSVLTNEKGLFVISPLQPHLTVMPIELFKDKVIETDTVVISFDGKPIDGAYSWFPGNSLDPVSISVSPYASDEISNPIVSEK